MAMIRINCYGERTAECAVVCRTPHTPVDTKFAGGCTFDRYGEDSPCAIHRLGVGEDGMVEARWAYGAWEDATALDYLHQLDETMEVQE